MDTSSISQTKKGKGVGHLCSNCGQMVECDLNTELYEALEGLRRYYNAEVSLDECDYPPVWVKALQALLKAEGGK